MRYTIIILKFVIVSSVSFGQQYFIKTEQIHLEEYLTQEKLLKSSLLKNEEEYSVISSNPSFDLAQPLRYVRTNVTFHPSPIIELYFSVPDSIVRMIVIDIDSSNYLKSQNNTETKYQEDSLRLNEFNKQYDIIKNELISRFGIPGMTENLEKKEFVGNKYWNRSDSWENDSSKVLMYMTFSDNDPKGTYRIRAQISYKFH